jgi:hypothetical protein
MVSAPALDLHRDYLTVMNVAAPAFNLQSLLGKRIAFPGGVCDLSMFRRARRKRRIPISQININ